MKVVVAHDPVLVPVSSVGPGSTFRWNNNFYVSTCRSLCERGIWGINLQDGCYIGAGTMLVERVNVEAHVL